MKTYIDKILMESRNSVYHNSNYTHECRCWGKCFEIYKEKTINMSIKKFKRLYGVKELYEVSIEYPSPNEKICKSCNKLDVGCYNKKSCPQKAKGGVVTAVYYGPWREFVVTETGIWTEIVCPVCGYAEVWAIGDGDERF